MSLILPGSTIGVLGGGPTGPDVRDGGAPARLPRPHARARSRHADRTNRRRRDQAAYDDLDAVRAFAQAVDVVTFEFENVSAAAVAEAEKHAIVRPNGRSLGIAQHRPTRRCFSPTTACRFAPFAPVRGSADVAAAMIAVGCPSVLKTATSGYDGKGQIRIDRPGDLGPAWDALDRREAVLEAFSISTSRSR